MFNRFRTWQSDILSFAVEVGEAPAMTTALGSHEPGKEGAGWEGQCFPLLRGPHNTA